ncbi:MAG: tRNA (adenosine(37)-N6)-dimethylallyltransferase MiaA [Eubacteriales bacterium]|nr:tRNA (adenosine(37)-N6)-dimethylallyltransferase MiaA [Eubacteriales bacterium]
MTQMPKLIAVVGTNASGKSGLGVELAKAYNGEIVSADSRQVFRGLDLGSGKITPEEMQGVAHHLIDVCAPNDFFSMADFQKLAYAAIEQTLARGKQPFLVGGTGLYVDCVTEGYKLSDTAPDLAYRDYLETFETPALYEMLRKAMPETDVDPKNRNRVMRILEKLHDGDSGHGEREPRYEVLKLGVSWDRETLAKRIDERLTRRMQQGMVDEVRRLMDEGATDTFLMKLGLEYRFLTRYIRGEFSSEAEMCEALALAIRQFAKRQMTWFRRDKTIHWLDMTADPLAQARALVERFLAGEELPAPREFPSVGAQ